jgi:hypothetical protein
MAGMAKGVEVPEIKSALKSMAVELDRPNLRMLMN